MTIFSLLGPDFDRPACLEATTYSDPISAVPTISQKLKLKIDFACLLRTGYPKYSNIVLV